MFGGVLLQQGLEVGAAGREDHLVSLAALAVALERTKNNNPIRILLCISLQARVTSQNDFSSLRCLKEATMLVWKSFHLKQNCCWSSIFLASFASEKKIGDKSRETTGLMRLNTWLTVTQVGWDEANIYVSTIKMPGLSCCLTAGLGENCWLQQQSTALPPTGGEKLLCLITERKTVMAP